MVNQEDGFKRRKIPDKINIDQFSSFVGDKPVMGNFISGELRCSFALILYKVTLWGLP